MVYIRIDYLISLFVILERPKIFNTADIIFTLSLIDPLFLQLLVDLNDFLKRLISHPPILPKIIQKRAPMLHKNIALEPILFNLIKLFLIIWIKVDRAWHFLRPR